MLLKNLNSNKFNLFIFSFGDIHGVSDIKCMNSNQQQQRDTTTSRLQHSHLQHLSNTQIHHGYVHEIFYK